MISCPSIDHLSYMCLVSKRKQTTFLTSLKPISRKIIKQQQSKTSKYQM